MKTLSLLEWSIIPWNNKNFTSHRDRNNKITTWLILPGKRLVEIKVSGINA